MGWSIGQRDETAGTSIPEWQQRWIWWWWRARSLCVQCCLAQQGGLSSSGYLVSTSAYLWCSSANMQTEINQQSYAGRRWSNTLFGVESKCHRLVCWAVEEEAYGNKPVKRTRVTRPRCSTREIKHTTEVIYIKQIWAVRVRILRESKCSSWQPETDLIPWKTQAEPSPCTG